MDALKIEDFRISNIIRKSADDNRILTLQDLIQWQQDVIKLIDKINFDNNGADYVKRLIGADAVDVDHKLSLNINGFSSDYGVYEIIDNDVTISRVLLSTWPTAEYKKIILKPGLGRQVIINTVDTGSITGDVIVSDQFGGSITLVGDRGDYVILEKRYADGSNCVYATPVVIT